MSQDISHLTDEEIVFKVQSGQVEPFSIIVERYEQKMTRYARKFLSGYEDIEDLIQNIFIKAYTNISGFDASRKFSPWLYRIAHNEFVNFIKKKKKEPLPFFDPDTIFPHLFSKDSTDKKIKEEELKRLIDTCLDKLDLKYREVLILYYLEELSYKEISDILQIPAATVGIRLKRAKEKINSIYKKYE